jgi:hypothetical protein
MESRARIGVWFDISIFVRGGSTSGQCLSRFAEVYWQSSAQRPVCVGHPGGEDKPHGWAQHDYSSTSS